MGVMETIMATTGLPAWGYMLLLTFLVFGATIRLTRFVTTDSLGGWLFRSPAEEWADEKETIRRHAIERVLDDTQPEPDAPFIVKAVLNRRITRLIDRMADGEPLSWQMRLVSGLACPFCVGFWIGLAVIVVTFLVQPVGWLAVAWTALTAALTLNYVAAHVSARID